MKEAKLKYIIIFLSLQILFSISAVCQKQTSIEFDKFRVGENSSKDSTTIGFTCKGKLKTNHTVEFEFLELENFKINPPKYLKSTITRSNHVMFSITKEDLKQPSIYKYKLNYRKGCKTTRPDNDFIYGFPLKSKFEQKTLLHKNGNDEINFPKTENDTVFATREGIISDISDEGQIEIQHIDCTYALYSNLKKNSSFFEIGESIRLGMPLAIIDNKNLSLSLYFYSDKNPEERISKNNTIKVGLPIQIYKPNLNRDRFLSANKSYSLINPKRITYSEMTGSEGISFSEQIEIFDTINFCHKQNNGKRKCGTFKFIGNKLFMIKDSLATGESVYNAQTKSIKDEYINPEGKVYIKATEREYGWPSRTIEGFAIFRDEFENVIHQDKINIIEEFISIPELVIEKTNSFIFKPINNSKYEEIKIEGLEFKILKFLLLCHNSNTSKKVYKGWRGLSSWTLSKYIRFHSKDYNIIFNLSVKPKFISQKLEGKNK